jgi:hypothetical protein
MLPEDGGVLRLVVLQELAIADRSFEYLKTYESEPKHQIN